MGWTMTPVAAPASSVRYKLNEIPPEVRDSVDEAYDFCVANPGSRLVVLFDDQATADLNKTYIRSYCEVRPVRLKASIWAGFASEGEDGNVTFSQADAEGRAPALSLLFVKYVKRSQANASAGNGQAESEAATALA